MFAPRETLNDLALSDPFVSLFLMGRFRLFRSGAAVSGLPVKAQALLAFLAIEGGPVSRERLAELIWPDRQTEQSRNSLRQAIYSIRRALGDGSDQILKTNPAATELSLTGVLVDASRITGNVPDTELESLAALCCVEFLTDFPTVSKPFDQWVIIRRQSLTNAAASILSRLALVQSKRGSLDEAFKTAQQLVALDPLREESHRLLIEMYSENGRRAEALRQYDTCARILRDELNVSPDAETAALAKRLRSVQRTPPANEDIAPESKCEADELGQFLIPAGGASPFPDGQTAGPRSTPTALLQEERKHLTEVHYRSPLSKLIWVAVAIVGAGALGVVALNRGETISAAWLVIAALCTYFIAYRFYALFVAKTVLGVDSSRPTPAVRHNDGLDYVPTNKYVLFGHHFAAIAGAGPLIGPVLAAQMGYLPGTLWILVGAVLAGGIQDMTVMFLSVRRDGRSLGDIVRTEIGPVAGSIVHLGVLLIMVILLAVIAIVFVKVLVGSPWGTFAVFATIPIAILMGLYSRFVRIGRIGEMSAIGVVLLLAALIYGRSVAETPELAQWFDLSGPNLALIIIGYGFVASVLPVWLLLAPRDYLSTFLKIGTMALLAAGILIVQPDLQMPAVTRFIDGSGPVWAGNLFPFLFITIACGAVSGFHSLISSGTTPKMVENESQLPLIGYGAMMTESFVAVMAMIGATVLHPGVYFAMNSPAALIGADAAHAAGVISNWGFVITPETLTGLAQEVGEKTLLSRTGGAATLAVGMATILSGMFGQTMMAVWYHFAILFEALFILTAVDAGTRVTRFMIQDMAGSVVPSFKDTESWANNFIGSGLSALFWGYFLYQGVIDPMGGINTLWPLFGIANQMLAGIALILCSVVLFKMKRQRYAWVTLVPTVWLLFCALTAGLQKVFSPSPSIGFLAHAQKFRDAAYAGKILPPAKTMEEMHRVIFNDYVDATLAGLFVLVVIVIAFYGLVSIRRALGHPSATPNRITFRDLVAKTVRLMVGLPDYETYVAHVRSNHPGEPVMTYEEFFRERQDARYAVGKGKFRGGCC